MYTLKSFFEINEKCLIQNYPGLSLRRLEREFQDNPHHLLNEKIKGDLLRGRPLAYIFKQSFFYNSFFFVDERVLIPRNETEILVAETIDVIKDKCVICEVGIGSGAISLSLLRQSDEIDEIIGIDISTDALEVAKINKFRHAYGVNTNKLKLVKGDRLEAVKAPLDIIVSNPPYIKKLTDLSEVHDKVDKFEPSTALYLPDHSYDLWFTDFFNDAYNKLKKDGHFLMEGHENHLEKQKEECEKVGFSSVSLIKDLTNRNRILKARK